LNKSELSEATSFLNSHRLFPTPQAKIAYGIEGRALAHTRSFDVAARAFKASNAQGHTNACPHPIYRFRNVFEVDRR